MKMIRIETERKTTEQINKGIVTLFVIILVRLPPQSIRFVKRTQQFRREQRKCKTRIKFGQ